MPFLRPSPSFVSPVWGGRSLARGYGKGSDPDARIGESWEIWRENLLPDGRTLGDVATLPLLVKLLDVRERLSVQVHPDDADAAALEGAPHGKSEAWVVLEAEPGARIARGLNREMSGEELADAARSGAIEAELAWREVRPGDVIDIPAGTIHTVGGGVLLYEVQQPADLTYRLYDWGRGRPLHLERAVAVAHRGPARPTSPPTPLGSGREEIFRGPHFVLERWRASACPGDHRLDVCTAVTAIAGSLTLNGEALRRGESAVLAPGTWRVAGDGVAILARPGAGGSPGV